MKPIFFCAALVSWGFVLSAQGQCFLKGEAGLTLPQARAYMLSLINRDRQSAGVAPVTLDLAASGAAQGHTDEMAAFDYGAHWGMDGKNPTERYTEGGNADSDAENESGSGGYMSECDDSYGSSGVRQQEKVPMPVSKDPRFPRSVLDEMEGDMIREQPPNDGHRLNIINADRTQVGIALSSAEQGGHWTVACTQEFVNHYGTYSPLPAAVPVGGAFDVQGTLSQGLSVQDVSLRFEDFPKPMTIEQLKATNSYGTPDNKAGDYYAGDGREVSVSSTPSGQAFSLHVAVPTTWKPGLYYVLIWASRPNGGGDVLVSERTILIGNVQATRWTAWMADKETAAGKVSSIHSRKGCTSGPSSKPTWAVQLRNDDETQTYRIQFQLFPSNRNQPVNWPAGSTAITLGPGQIYVSPVDVSISNPLGCGTDAHLYYALNAVAIAGAR